MILRQTRPIEYIIISQDGVTPRARMHYTKRKSWYHIASKRKLFKFNFKAYAEDYDEYKGIFNYGTVHAAEIMRRTEDLLANYCKENKV